jgi:hypothetical protein
MAPPGKIIMGLGSLLMAVFSDTSARNSSSMAALLTALRFAARLDSGR